jgi:glycosyltransferase involved in cell wall biosynthesis
MKILFVSTYFLPNIGGTEIVMYQYGKKLVDRGHSVTVYTGNALRPRPAQVISEEVIDGILVKRFKLLHLPPPFCKLFITPSIIPSLFSADFDVITVFDFSPTFITLMSCLIAKIMRVPLVLYPQYLPSRVNLYSGFVRKPLRILFDKLVIICLFKLANYIVALTKAEGKYYRKYGIRNVKTIYEAISINDPPTEREILNFRKKYGLRGNTKVIIIVGRILKYKGVDFLIKALSYLKKDFPKVRLLVIGPDGGYLSSCIKLSRQLNCQKNIIFTGAISNLELACAYEVADIVAAVSQYEAYGRTIVEAWSHRKPVISTKNVAVSELISQERGIIVDFGNIRALAREIKRLLRDRQLAVSLGMNGYLLTKKLTLEKTVDKIEKVYSMVLEK